MKIGIALASLVLASACGQPGPNANAQASNAPTMVNATNVAIAEAGNTQIAADDTKSFAHTVEACKGAIAIMMGRDPATMRGKLLEDGVAHVSYRRPDDNKLWQSRCEMIDTNHLRWAAFDAFGDGQQGRWRDEDKITVTIEGKQLKIEIAQDGMDAQTKSYPLSDLK
jgi:hypothetical protein